MSINETTKICLTPNYRAGFKVLTIFSMLYMSIMLGNAILTNKYIVVPMNFLYWVEH